MEKQKLIILTLAALLIIAAGYIITEKVNFCEQSKNESYTLGFNQGVERWNSAVISNVNNKGSIPYWFNNSYYELNVAQLCGDLNE